MQSYTEKDLIEWDERIKKVVESFGLDPFPQIFEICDSEMMLGYMAYSGMPARYPHWSFGKHFEKQKTLHQLGIVGLPYEMVINANPSLAYLMVDNSLLLQILTIAHVYAHNDFFRNNVTFREIRPEFTLDTFKANADRVRKYCEDPTIGSHAVEELLDTAHALTFNCKRYSPLEIPQRQPDVHKVDQEEPAEITYGFGYRPKLQTDSRTTRKKIPPKPEENLLLFIRDNNPFLTEWQKDLLTIVHTETLYFIPQIETKIMNEGWASIWHKRILEKLELPADLRLELYVRHNQVIQPMPGGLNPYFVGYKMFEDIEKRWDEPTEEEREVFKRRGGEGGKKIFQVREIDRDESFLRQYLTKELMREMNLFQHEMRGRDRVVTKVSSEDDWEEVKRTLLQNVGMNSYPIIKVHDADFQGTRRLYLVHDYEGRELDSEYTSRTLKYLQKLWDAPVILETVRVDKKVRIKLDNESETIESVKNS